MRINLLVVASLCLLAFVIYALVYDEKYTAIAILLCTTFIGGIIVIFGVEQKQKDDSIMSSLASKVKTPDTIAGFVSMLQMDVGNAQETVLVLNAIKKMLHKSEKEKFKAKEVGIFKYITTILSSDEIDFHKIYSAVSVLEELLRCLKTRMSIIGDENELKILCDCLVVLSKELSSRMANGFEKEDNDDTLEKEEDDSTAVSPYASLRSNGFTKQIDEELAHGNSGTAPAVETQYTLCCNCLRKITITLGVLCMDTDSNTPICTKMARVAQSCVGDRGGIQQILTNLKLCKASPLVAKWGLWTLIHVSFAHPANKREIIEKDGLTIILVVLNLHVKLLEVVQQGLSLLFNILANDDHAMMSLSKIRQMALQNGVADYLQLAQVKYKDVDVVTNLCNAILQLLMSDWS